MGEAEKCFTIDELVEEVNNVLSLSDRSFIDSRQSKTLSARRIKDYTTKELISKPFKSGRNVYYTELHLNELISLRELQFKGLSDKALYSFKKENDLDNQSQDEDKNSVLDILDEIKGVNQFKTKDSSLIGSLSSYSSAGRELNLNLNTKEIADHKLIKKMGLIEELKKDIRKNNLGIEPKKWLEYEIKEGVFLKVRDDQETTKIESKLAEIKKIIKGI